ncbi:hypothetical protein NIES2104_32090 [Leptolyngbya sp. NIES-2104]|nr:hypothetical protein NIES2104_32090 [Leptolyngbya sp. NIES-2104]
MIYVRQHRRRTAKLLKASQTVRARSRTPPFVRPTPQSDPCYPDRDRIVL